MARRIPERALISPIVRRGRRTGIEVRLMRRCLVAGGSVRAGTARFLEARARGFGKWREKVAAPLRAGIYLSWARLVKMSAYQRGEKSPVPGKREALLGPCLLGWLRIFTVARIS